MDMSGIPIVIFLAKFSSPGQNTHRCGSILDGHPNQKCRGTALYLFSVLGFFSLFLFFIGSELKADQLSRFKKTYPVSKKIKWVKYDKSIKEKGIETVTKEFEEFNNQEITKIKKEET